MAHKQGTRWRGTVTYQGVHLTQVFTVAAEAVRWEHETLSRLVRGEGASLRSLMEAYLVVDAPVRCSTPVLRHRYQALREFVRYCCEGRLKLDAAREVTRQVIIDYLDRLRVGGVDLMFIGQVRQALEEMFMYGHAFCGTPAGVVPSQPEIVDHFGQGDQQVNVAQQGRLDLTVAAERQMVISESVQKSLQAFFRLWTLDHQKDSLEDFVLLAAERAVQGMAPATLHEFRVKECLEWAWNRGWPERDRHILAEVLHRVAAGDGGWVSIRRDSVAQALLCSPPTVSEIISRAVGAGLLIRKKDGRLRAYQFSTRVDEITRRISA